MTEWQVKMKRHAFRPQLNVTVQSRKQNNLDLTWKEGLPQLLVCQMAVSMSWVCFHTSSERGHSGLPADMKIRTILELIGILWSYFGVRLGSANSPLYSACHLAVSWNYASYHTSYERGHSGLPADINIRTIVQLIGILWSYFGVYLGSANIPLYFACHSATSWHIFGYHMSDERGHP